MIYVLQLIGYELLEDLFCLLLQTLHRLKQSLRLWYQILYKFLISMAFCRTEAVHSIFIQGKIIITVYDDDLLLDRKNIDAMNSIKFALKRQFKIKNLRPCQYYLGIGLTWYCSRSLIFLSLFTYITKTLCQFGHEGCHFVYTAMDRKEYVNLEWSNTDLDLEIWE